MLSLSNICSGIEKIPTQPKAVAVLLELQIILEILAPLVVRIRLRRERKNRKYVEGDAAGSTIASSTIFQQIEHFPDLFSAFVKSDTLDTAFETAAFRVSFGTLDGFAGE